jgi:N-acetylneuraminate synthase
MSRILDVFARTGINPLGFPKPYIIAEAGVNHECQMDLAKRLIDEAKEGGADAIKFQTYKADTLASKYSPAYWDRTKEATSSQFELFSRYDKFWKHEYEVLKQYCDRADIEFLSTPFDLESARFLNDLMPVFKISSSDITNKPFIQYISAFKKPIILSTGASELYEIHEALSWIAPYSCQTALLHCVLNYPTEDAQAHLGMITHLKSVFPKHLIGYSDHTLPYDMLTLQMATLLGAVILEKHFTHDKALPGNDHYHGMDYRDLAYFKKQLHRMEVLYGSNKKQALETERPAIQNARRSLVVTQNLTKGHVLTIQDITFKRPAHGISPKYFDQILGKPLGRDMAKDTPLLWDDVTLG